METVEQLCEYLVLINKGKNVLQGKVTEIRNSHKEGIFHVTSEGLGEGNLDGLEILSQSPVDFTFRGKSGLTPNELLRDLIHRGIPINGFEEVKPTLNDIFIKTVKSLGDA
jgi:ABC-2 type transport system ATP-binding protein